MVSSPTAEPVASTSSRTSLKASAPEFRLLGLRPREARLEVIRRALTETAGDVKASEHWIVEEGNASQAGPQEDNRLAQVTVAGYRLLDPRRRRTLFERVQLLLWSEDDLDSATGSLWDVARPNDKSANRDASAATSKAQRATSKSAANTGAPPVASPTQLAEERQAALEVFRSLRTRDRRATALWIGVAALAVSLPGAVALVLALI